jgi:hypothetical protein
VTRRLISIIATTALLFALLPATAALASGSGSASINRSEVFPGAHSFTVTVTNTATNPLPPFIMGQALDWVSVILPSEVGVRFPAGLTNEEIAGQVQAPSGWTKTIVNTANRQEIILTGGTLAATASMNVTYPATVGAPLDSDRTAITRVGISANGGDTINLATGSLTTIVRILEIIAGSAKATTTALDPDPVAQFNRATGGQRVDYTFTVRNHAQQAVSTTVTLAQSPGYTPVNGNTRTQSAGGGLAETPFTFTVDLTPLTAGNQIEQQFAATASAANAASQQFARTLTVQRAPQLGLVTNTLQPRYVSPLNTETFEAALEKQFIPTATVLSGTLQFAATTATIVGTPITWDANGAGGRRTIETEGVNAQGADGDHPAQLVLAIRDGNGYEFTQTVNQMLNGQPPLVTIDGILPLVNILTTILPTHRSVQQTHAKNGDTITVTGEVRDRNADLSADGLTVRLQPIGGGTEINATNISKSVVDGGYNFTATFSGAGVDFGSASLFHAVADARDLARNSGGGEGNTLPVDNFVPTLEGLNGRLIEDATYDTKPVIQVYVDSRSSLYRGCRVEHWQVDGETFGRPAQVLLSDGSPCDPDSAQPSPDNSRILVLSSTRPRDYQTTVTYVPSPTTLPLLQSANPSFNGAGRDVVQSLQDIFSEIFPPLPILGQLRRNAGAEIAVFDDDRYWTRFGGTDLQIPIVNIRANEKVRVTNQAGQLLFEGTAGSNASESNPYLINVPLVPGGGDTPDGVYTLRIQLIGVTNLFGNFREIQVQKDTVAPQLASVARIAANQVRVVYDDVIWSGANSAANWRAFQSVDGGDSLAAVFVRSVTTDPDNGSARLLEVDFEDAFGAFAGVEYDHVSNSRYQDRAGNEAVSPNFRSA